MRDWINEWLLLTREGTHNENVLVQQVRPPLTLIDKEYDAKYILSVQASVFHWCFPKENNADEYSAVEVGIMKLPVPPELVDFVDTFELTNVAVDPDTVIPLVLGHIPVTKLNRLIERCGGINQ